MNSDKELSKEEREQLGKDIREIVKNVKQLTGKFSPSPDSNTSQTPDSDKNINKLIREGIKMKNTVLNLQDLFLNNARKERIPVTIFLMNGVQVKGNVKGFDSYIILLEGENRQQNMIYKHAVSTIVPGKYINLQNQQQNNR